jgi:hypothetical protein
MTELERLLEENRPKLEAALADAESELKDLDERRDKLMALINKTRAMLEDSPSPPSPTRLTLHEAIKLILERRPSNCPCADFLNPGCSTVRDASMSAF